MKLENNFTREESQKTVGELYCSEELKQGRLSEFIFVSVLNIFPVSVKRRLRTADCGLLTADQG